MWNWISNNFGTILQISVFVLAIGGGAIGKALSEITKQRAKREQQQAIARAQAEALRTGRGQASSAAGPGVGARVDSGTAIGGPAGSPVRAQATAGSALGATGVGSGGAAGAGTRGAAGPSPRDALDAMASRQNAELARRRKEAAERLREQVERRRDEARARGEAARRGAPGKTDAGPAGGPAAGSASGPTTGVGAQGQEPSKKVSTGSASGQASSGPRIGGVSADGEPAVAPERSSRRIRIEPESDPAGSLGPRVTRIGSSGAGPIPDGIGVGVSSMLGTPAELRRAIVLAEVLARPKSDEI